jgi:uncharacterized protein YbjT (DUF2867 family)
MHPVTRTSRTPLNVVLFGATGMVGGGALLECLDSPHVESVLVVGRRPCGVVHPKLAERLLDRLDEIDSIRPQLADRDACFFCVGVSAVGMAEHAYRRVTRDLTLAVARAVLASAPRCTFIFVSGAGADATGSGRVMWTRVKGETETAILGLGFGAAYVFRPGIIQPVRGVRSRTAWYRVLYTLLRPVGPALRRLAPRFVTTTADMGRAMIEVALHGAERPVLETRDINDASARLIRNHGG